MSTFKLDSGDCTRLDKLALKWADDDNDPEHAWVLRGIVDANEPRPDMGMYCPEHVYWHEYNYGKHAARYCPSALSALDDFLNEGRVDEYHLRLELGYLCDLADDKRYEEEEE